MTAKTVWDLILSLIAAALIVSGLLAENAVAQEEVTTWTIEEPPPLSTKVVVNIERGPRQESYDTFAVHTVSPDAAVEADPAIREFENHPPE